MPSILNQCLSLSLALFFVLPCVQAQSDKWRINPQNQPQTPKERTWLLDLNKDRPASYQASFDYELLPRSGAENLSALLRLPYAPWKDKSKRSNRRAWWRIAYRATKLVFIDYAAADYYTTLQRELFGTGAYARILGRDSIRYKITPFSIFSRPTVRYSLPLGDSLRALNLDEQIALSMAGFESTGNSMAEVLRQKFLSGGEMTHEMSLLYLTTKLDQVRQVLRAGSDFRNLDESNIEAYVYNLNLRYLDSSTVALGRAARDSFQYNLSGLKTRLILSTLLDPSLYFAGANVYDYLLDAKKHRGMKALRLGNWGYFPTIHLGLSPFGEEWYWHNYLIDPKQRIWHLKLRYGQNIYTGSSFSMAVQAANYRVEGVGTFNLRAEIWQQPNFELGGLERKVLGGTGGIFAASFRSLPLFDLLPLQLYGEFGYKTGGYLAGENLDASVIARVGLSYPNFFGKGERENRELSYKKSKKR